jgi:hypothetical protein
VAAEEDFPGLVYVVAHLVDQGVDGVEADRAAEAVGEVDRHVRAV